MKKKLLDLSKSISFWYAVILSVAFLLDQTNVIPGAYAKAIELFASVGIVTKRIDGFR